ncbi:MAG TPA: DUF3185 family protein [Planctomycetota bacterium]|nr:DUF3185 family protein [Planctomycetota bacterium]
MRKFVGATVIVLGVILVIAGLNASDSVASRFSRLFTGSSTDKTIWLLIGGACALIFGMSLTFFRKGQRA